MRNRNHIFTEQPWQLGCKWSTDHILGDIRLEVRRMDSSRDSHQLALWSLVSNFSSLDLHSILYKRQRLGQMVVRFLSGGPCCDAVTSSTTLIHSRLQRDHGLLWCVYFRETLHILKQYSNLWFFFAFINFFFFFFCQMVARLCITNGELSQRQETVNGTALHAWAWKFCFLPSAKGNMHAFKQIQALDSLETETYF